MRDLRKQVDDLAALMDEFRLEQASLNLAGFEVTFRRSSRPQPVSTGLPETPAAEPQIEDDQPGEPEASGAAVAGQPVISPMAGIFYVQSSPSSPPFVKEGDTVAVGQTIGLIEAMKVFNEIPTPFAGTVLEISVESGAVVQPGQVLVRIG